MVIRLALEYAAGAADSGGVPGPPGFPDPWPFPLPVVELLSLSRTYECNEQ